MNALIARYIGDANTTKQLDVYVRKLQKGWNGERKEQYERKRTGKG